MLWYSLTFEYIYINWNITEATRTLVPCPPLGHTEQMTYNPYTAGWTTERCN